MEQSKEIKQKWKEPKNFDIYSSVIFSCYFWKGDWGLGFASNQL